MTNDRRMVPGPSDEEIERFIITNWLEGKPPVTQEWMRAMVNFVRAALARWGAQTDYDAEKVEALLGNYERLLFEARDVYIGWLHKKIESVVSVEWLAEEKAKVSAVRSSRRPKRRVVEGWIVTWRGSGDPSRWFFPERLDAEIRCSGAEQPAKVRIKILDAQEEGS